MTEELNTPENESSQIKEEMLLDEGTDSLDELISVDGEEDLEEPKPLVESDWDSVEGEEIKEEIKEPSGRAKVLYPVTDKKLNNDEIPLALPSVGYSELEEFVSSIDKIEEEDLLENVWEWTDTLKRGSGQYAHDGQYQERLREDGSVWLQGAYNAEGTERATTGSVTFNSKPGELRGEAALLKVTRAIGLGDVTSVCLPHTGIWITIKPPTEKTLIEFYSKMFRQKIELGRESYGLTLSNNSVAINNDMFNIILEHTHSINSKHITKDNLDEHMLISDFPFLVLGFASSIYPKGYDIERACVTDPTKCTHIEKDRLLLGETLWIDDSSLSKAQKTILYNNRSSKLTQQHHEKYILDHSRLSAKTVKLKNHNGETEFSIGLKVPTFREHVHDGLGWIYKINDVINDVVLTQDLIDEYSGGDNTAEENYKTAELNSYIRATALRRYSHYVEYIQIDDNTIKGRTEINAALEALSSDDVIRNEIMENVFKYQADTTIAVVGIPDYECVVCKKHQNPEPISDRWVNVIPIDIMSTIFLLLTSKISRVFQREI